MILTKQTGETRLNSESNLVNRFGGGSLEVIQKLPRGGHASTLPPFLRTTVAILARSRSDLQRNIGKEFGISQQEVHSIGAGKVKVDEAAVDSALDQVRDLALEKLMTSIGLMDEDKLAAQDAKGLSTIAANMSKVVEKTLPSRVAGGDVTLVLYAPNVRKEEGYKVVEIG